MQGRHTRTTNGRLRRKLIGIPVWLWLMATTLAAAAAIGYAVLLGSSGTVTAADTIDVSYDTNTTATPSVGDPTCSLDRVNGEEIDIGFTNALPGDQCAYSVEITSAGDAAAVVFGFALPGGAGDVTASVAQCGQVIPTGTTASVDFYLTAEPSFSPGTNLTLDPTADGLELGVSRLYDPASCVQN